MINIKDFFLLFLLVVEVFWKATVRVAWGISGLILFGGLMLQYGTSGSLAESFFGLSRFLIKNWVAFWFVFLALDFHDGSWRLRK